MTQILPHLYLGTQRESRNEAQLIALGITHLLCVTESFRFPSDPRLKHLHVPISDVGDSDLQACFYKCFDFIDDSRLKSGRTFLFCQLAQNRSPSITIAYLMHHLKKPLIEAYHIVQKEKSDISPHERYFKQLQLLDQKLFGSVSMTEADRGGSVQELIRSLWEKSD